MRSIPKHADVYEYRIIRKDGQVRWIQEYCQNLCDDSGKPIIVRGAEYDITERKEAEEALKMSESLLRATGKMARVGGWEFDVETLKQVWTQEIYEIHEVDLDFEPTVPKGIDFYAPEHRPIIAQAVQRAIEYGETFDLELMLITAKGNRLWVHAIGQAHKSNGKTTKIFGTFQDITKRKMMVEALRERDEFNFALFQHNPIETIVTDLEGRVVKCNIAKKKSGDRIPNIGDVMYRDYAGKHEIDMYTEMIECIRMGKLKKFPELKYGDRFMLIKIAPFSMGAIITSQDITESKRAEIQLRKDKRKLRSLALELTISEGRERRRIAEYLHDMISQALVVIKLKLGTLQELKDPGPAAILNKEISELLEQAIESTRSITFDLSSPVLDKLGFEPAVEWLCEKMAEDHGLAIDFISDSSKKGLDDDVKRFLYRSTRELLMNVVKHAHAHRVKVSVLKNKGIICITVDDDGVGFRESMDDNRYLERGFGLFSIRERLDHLGGSMIIDSNPGRGIRVSLYWKERRLTKNRSNYEN